MSESGLNPSRAIGVACVIGDKNDAAVTAIADRNVILLKGRVAFDGSSAKQHAQPELLQRCLGI